MIVPVWRKLSKRGRADHSGYRDQYGSCRWNWHESRLDEPLPKVMVDRMPVVHATAITPKDKRTKSLEYGQFEPYDCPVYRYPNRTDKYLVFRVQLRSDLHPSHWKLRGTALLCSTE